MNANPMPPNVARGRELYETQIRPKVEPDHHGEFLVIDTLTGEYEIDADQVAATRRAKQRFGTGENLYTLRIGYRGVAKMGFRGRFLSGR